MPTMENHHEEKENTERRNSNTEYLPTKCRITRPPPPKPATNPLQFIKVAPCALYRKAQEQIKKVEEIKSTRQDIRDEAEDWQQNLDNWKSSRRKRQEHIIERVVEVKKFEQEEHGRSRRKSKTFNEMIEERSKGRHKINIPIYTDDDSNDLSDYGIGSSSSKTNSIKDVDTDDSCSVLDDNTCETSTKKDVSSSTTNQNQSEDTISTSKSDDVKTSSILTSLPSSTYTTNLYTTLSNNTNTSSSISSPPSSATDDTKQPKTNDNEKEKKTDTKVYTYEGAIQDYRARMKSKVNLDDAIFNRTPKDTTKSKEYTEAQTVVPKGQIFQRKELFEIEKPIEINHYDSNTTRRLTDDFINAQSIKQRLRSLERCREQMFKNDDKSELTVGSIKERLQSFYKQNEADNKNNNNYPSIFSKSISNYLLDKSNSASDFEMKSNRTTLEWKPKDEVSDRSSSPEADIYMNKLNMFNRDLDNLMYAKLPLDDYYSNNYPASTSSIDLLGASSDREDSGIHTADVSCSVSQADEPVEDTDLMLPHCIEKLKNENKTEINDPGEYKQSDEDEPEERTQKDDINEDTTETTINEKENYEAPIKYTLKDLIVATEEFLDSAKKDSTQNLEVFKEEKKETPIMPNVENKTIIYENVEIRPLLENSVVPIDCITIDLFSTPPKTVEPPKVKPPPPPPPEDEEPVKPTSTNIKRLNSTKRIKKELHIKRSNFLGLEEPTDDQIDPDIPIDRPPDINVFLQTESKMEKTLYKKMQESQEGELSKVESQDSGLDIERGRLSSDTWCSSIGDSSHGRQDSEPTNSTISEEDEITKKEREIIEMVEKEEKSRDNTEFVNQSCDGHVYGNTLTIENTRDAYSLSPNSIDIQDSEVLKVEHQLLQLEKEELERQRENLLFRESCAKAKLQNNRHSLENICENLDIYPQYDGTNYRKSMPELQLVTNDCCKSPNVPNNFYKLTPHLDVPYRKSFPENDLCRSFDHRKSMPELQQEVQRLPRQPILPGKPLRPFNKEHKDRESDMANLKQTRPISRHSLQALSAVPRQRHVPSDNWIQPRAHNETKSYNQHWLFQEAELRRISEQQKNASLQNRTWLQQSRQEKHIPDSVIQTLTQRVQNRTVLNDRNTNLKRSDNNTKDYIQRPYISNKQTLGHASPMSYPPHIAIDDSQDRVLSVSGKKKCSYCGNELGRGAAMIIESLCLFYHMECFKCCVCHMQLGDGLMGTDVRVRNQKLHCHNCYSSDDGVKFSCV